MFWKYQSSEVMNGVHNSRDLDLLNWSFGGFRVDQSLLGIGHPLTIMDLMVPFDRAEAL